MCKDVQAATGWPPRRTTKGSPAVHAPQNDRIKTFLPKLHSACKVIRGKLARGAWTTRRRCPTAEQNSQRRVWNHEDQSTDREPVSSWHCLNRVKPTRKRAGTDG